MKTTAYRFVRALLACAPLFAGCSSEPPDPCEAAPGDTCLTISVKGTLPTNLDGATFVFSGATQATKAVDLAGSQVTKPPFTVGFRIAGLAMEDQVDVLCVGGLEDTPVASGTAGAVLGPGTHAKVTLTLAGLNGDEDFGDLSPTATPDTPDAGTEEDASAARRPVPLPIY